MRATAIIKLGGSLLEPPAIPGLPARLQRVLEAHGGGRPILIVGGGPVVDCLRRWDRRFRLGEEVSHWLSVRALSITARVVENLLPDLELASSDASCRRAWARGRTPILEIHPFLARQEKGHLRPLPRSWRITTDSIAARAAQHFGAPLLVLLKSVTLKAGTTALSAMDQGLVDPYFGSVLDGLQRVLFLNLRQARADGRLPPGRRLRLTARTR